MRQQGLGPTQSNDYHRYFAKRKRWPIYITPLIDSRQKLDLLLVVSITCAGDTTISNES